MSNISNMCICICQFIRQQFTEVTNILRNNANFQNQINSSGNNLPSLSSLFENESTMYQMVVLFMGIAFLFILMNNNNNNNNIARNNNNDRDNLMKINHNNDNNDQQPPPAI